MNSPSVRPKRKQLSVAACLAAGAVVIGLAGCGSEPEEQAAAVPQYTPPPPAPKGPSVTPIEELMAQLRIDSRIMLPEDRAPDNDPARIAVLEFFDGFARGDADAVGKYLSALDRRELEAMVESGQWQETIEGIASIEIETGSAGAGAAGAEGGSVAADLLAMGTDDLKRLIESGEFQEMAGLSDSQYQQLKDMVGTPEFQEYLDEAMETLGALAGPASSAMVAGDQCALAMFTVNGEYQAQLWYYHPQGDGFEFQSAPTPPNMVNRLEGVDWIKSWHDIIAHELMLASQPDERVKPPKRHLDDEDTGSGGGGVSPSGPSAPSRPGGTPPPIKAPRGPGVG